MKIQAQLEKSFCSYYVYMCMQSKTYFTRAFVCKFCICDKVTLWKEAVLFFMQTHLSYPLWFPGEDVRKYDWFPVYSSQWNSYAQILRCMARNVKTNKEQHAGVVENIFSYAWAFKRNWYTFRGDSSIKILLSLFEKGSTIYGRICSQKEQILYI